ncbi:hypothetical protein [Crenobacter cavernae]|uniref:Uncharacterized protein n=1 Tax=Crenobacter cavernae TaxID=2290923 RepID=A0A345Y9T5_9NEIS|nr:hypothetical protein [Crenobacter cavernae]AXK40687.1 hypothetical protein DWG20_15350 [Crenobacter cavernae]
MNTPNAFLYLAENHQTLSRGPWHGAAQGTEPLADPAVLRLAESHAEVICSDVADSLQALSRLLSNCPRETGDEAALMPNVGALLRILGDALEFGLQAQYAAQNRRSECENAAATAQALPVAAASESEASSRRRRAQPT